MLVGTYDAKRVVVTVNGVPVRHNGVSIAYDDSDWNKSTGIQGQHSRSRVNGDGGQITIAIPQTFTQERVYLDSIAKADKLSGTGTSVIQVKDLISGEGVVSRQCWLVSRPEKAFEGDVTDRSYVYDTSEIVDL